MVKPIAADRGALEQKMRSASLVWSTTIETIKGDVAELAKAQGVDAIVVLAETKYDGWPAPGVSAVFRNLYTPLKFGVVYADVAAAIVTARGKIVAVAPHGIALDFQLVDVESYGIGLPLKDRLTPEVSGMLRDTAGDVLVKNAYVRLSQLGIPVDIPKKTEIVRKR